MQAQNALFRTSHLIMVTPNNNNKFYEMSEREGGTFEVRYGRVGTKGAFQSYSMQLWDTKYREKIRKGYVDQTHLFAQTESEVDIVDIEDRAVQKLVNELMAYAKKSVSYHYNVNAEQVTEKQLAEAQQTLDEMVASLQKPIVIQDFNQQLIRLYQIIPRTMRNVKDHLIPEDTQDLETITNLLAEEQATLDVMRGQVQIHQSTLAQKEKVNLLEAMNLEVSKVENSKALKQIKKMMGGQANLFKNAFEVKNLRTQTDYDTLLSQKKNKKTALFWHGSRNENWMSILENGLVLRPANAVINGKMFGYGLYFADKFMKSLNYSSLSGSFWTRGNSNRGFLALYEVHLGKSLKVKNHAAWCGQLNEEQLKKRGSQYDSLFAQGGADLINNEYIIYNQAQCTIKYLVEVGS